MAAEPCELTTLNEAFRRFAFPAESTQTSDHIKRLHWYVACRLVIEGGFDPDTIQPRPPFKVTESQGKKLLHHEPNLANGKERTIYGGLKTKDIDVSICLDGVGPVLAISLKGTHNAFRNLTNRMEEAAGDCTNLHLAYPAMVYGFWHLLRANEQADENPKAHFALGDTGRYRVEDLAITEGGNLAQGVARYAQALVRLSDREDLRDSPSRYEACALTLVGVRGAAIGITHPLVHETGAILDFNRMFRRLLDLYDRRFVYQAPAMDVRTRRCTWSTESPVLEEIIRKHPAFGELIPRTS